MLAFFVQSMARLHPQPMTQISIWVSTLSGKQALIRLRSDSTVCELKSAASKELGGACKLVFGQTVLMQNQSLMEAGLSDNAVVGTLVFHPQIAATAAAFALIQGDGAVITWGKRNEGGNSEQVRSQSSKPQKALLLQFEMMEA